jgi:transposase
MVAGCPRTTLYNRFVRWRTTGVWDCILSAISEAYDGDTVMIDSSCVRVHQHGAAVKGGQRPAEMVAWTPRRTRWRKAEVA